MLVMEPKKKKPAEKKQTEYARSGTPLNVWITDALMESLEKRCASTRRSKTAEVSLALEKHLKEDEE